MSVNHELGPVGQRIVFKSDLVRLYHRLVQALVCGSLEPDQRAAWLTTASTY